MLRLETEYAAHLEGMDQALLMSVAVRNVIDPLAGDDLFHEVAFEHPVAAHDAPPVGHGEGRLFVRLGAVGRLGEIVDRRIEDIENQAAVGVEMAPYGGKAGELVGHRNEMLERAERNRHQSK